MNRLLSLKVFLIFVVLGLFFGSIFAQGQDSLEFPRSEYSRSFSLESEAELAGEFFGIPVTLSNYYAAKGMILRFNAKWRLGKPKDDQELEDLVWQELLLSFEAYQQQIEAPAQDIEDQIGEILRAEKVSFNWRKDKEAYNKWVEQRLGYSPEVFEGQIIQLVKIHNLREKIIAETQPKVTKQDAFNKFMDEQSSLSVELAKFNDLAGANDFYRKLEKDPGLWEKRKKQDPESFIQPGFVAADFLINIWRFARKDVYKMIGLSSGLFYKPSLMYEGYAVFKILDSRPGDPKGFALKKDYYFNRVVSIKKADGFKEWLKDLKQRANIKIYLDKS